MVYNQIALFPGHATTSVNCPFLILVLYNKIDCALHQKCFFNQFNSASVSYVLS